VPLEPVLAKPESAVPAMTGLVGLIGLAGAVWAMFRFDLPQTHAVYLCLGVPAACMTAYELIFVRSFRRPPTVPTALPSPSLSGVAQRCATKLVGTWSIWLVIAALYRYLPYYDDQAYLPYFDFLKAVAPFAIALSIPYVLAVDRVSEDKHDEAWHFGRLLLTGRCADPAAARNHLLNYTIKAFFLAFMFPIVVAQVEFIRALEPASFAASAIAFYGNAVAALFFIDVVFGTVGYLMTLRILDAQIRSPNPFLLGWVVALACYPPFIVMGRDGTFLEYGHGHEWHSLIAADSPLGIAVIVASLGLLCVYAWATVAFGLRFSNLTHRGIITSGPYAFSKHPAYIAKNIFWWLAVLPFVPVAGLDHAVGSCMALAAVNLIYYLRARTEEAHLGQDPVYRQYAAYIEKHGVVGRARAAVVSLARAAQALAGR
jgi:protein-S-isoprenylcysteine O-methyltransferase Ste14